MFSVCNRRLGNKRKWVSLPLEEASLDGGNKTDAEPGGDSVDPASPDNTLHSNRAHDSSRSKSLCSFTAAGVSSPVLTLHASFC